ncbi:MAG: metallophosphoesterase family protein [Ilumatobacteraceae bacterium]
MSVTIAAVGDIHLGTEFRGTIGAALAAASTEADILLLAGDLTRCGSIEEMHIVVDELSNVQLPTIAVLGNHDLHSDLGDECRDVLEGGGIRVLDRSSTVITVGDTRVGIAGATGFGGGFDGAIASNFGEREMRRFAERSQREADGLAAALAALAELECATRIALTHYSPVEATLEGERREIYPFLGSGLLASAIDRAGADLALHGHAHRGVECGTTAGGVPVHNVAMPVIQRPYRLFTFDV